MSLSTRNPIRMAGMSPFSGGINTGQVNNTWGGQQVFSNLSGVAVDTLVWSGGGRLDTMCALNVGLSGRSVIFYDATAPTSGGPFQTSGNKVLAVLAARVGVQTISGSAVPTWDGSIYTVGAPFFSGLYVAPLNGSGVGGFNCTFTPEASLSGQTL